LHIQLDINAAGPSRASKQYSNDQTTDCRPSWFKKFVKFNMQDRVEEKKRINELISINKSLTALGHCIKLMGESKAHIP